MWANSLYKNVKIDDMFPKKSVLYGEFNILINYKNTHEFVDIISIPKLHVVQNVKLNAFANIIVLDRAISWVFLTMCDCKMKIFKIEADFSVHRPSSKPQMLC